MSRKMRVLLENIVVVIASCLALFTLTALAVTSQGDEVTYTFTTSSTVITYALPWVLAEHPNGSITLSNGSTRANLYDSGFVTTLLTVEPDSAVDVLTAFRTVLGSDSQTRFDESRLAEQLLDLRTVTVYPYIPDDASFTGLFVALQFTDGSYGFADILAPAENAEVGQLEALGLLVNFDSFSSVVCTVNTDQANAVQVRVGPGTNRSVITFLPVGVEFMVLGQAVIDGEVWWQLNKMEVASRSAAAELWVAATDVNMTPECSAIRIVPTPPIIPTRDGTLENPFDPLCPGSTSAEFVAIAWATTDVATVSACVANLRFWENEAQTQQALRMGQCNIQPTAAQLSSFFADNWALADLATGYFILGLRHKALGQTTQAREAFNMILNNYSCAWAWDPPPHGWFWSLAQGARTEMP